MGNLLTIRKRHQDKLILEKLKEIRDTLHQISQQLAGTCDIPEDPWNDLDHKSPKEALKALQELHKRLCHDKASLLRVSIYYPSGHRVRQEADDLLLLLSELHQTKNWFQEIYKYSSDSENQS